MKLQIKLFAVARQRVGRDAVEVELPAQATVRQLRGALVEQFPTLVDVIAHARFAIDSEYAGEGAAIPGVCEVAMIPPVSGG